MKFRKIILSSFLVLLSIAVFSLATFAAGPRDCTTPQDWRTFGGFTHDDCPNGLGYPSFNAYNDPKNGLLDNALFVPEFKFAFTRIYKLANGQKPSNLNTAGFGYKNEITANVGDKIDVWNYMHNAGSPRLNNTSAQSTIAKNVRVKFLGFTQNSSGHYVTAPSSRHVLKVSITSDNTTPRTIEDEYIINTPSNKILKLDFTQPVYIDKCVSLNTDKKIPVCDSYETEQKTPDELVDNNGMLVSSKFSGSGSRNDFFASEGYRVAVSASLVIEDAPANEACENLTLIADEIDQTRKTGTFSVDIDPDNAANRNNLKARIVSGTGSVAINKGANRSDNDISINVAGWSNNTKLEVYIEGASDSDCRKQYVFTDSGGEICQRMEYEKLSDNAELRTAKYRITLVENKQEFHDNLKVERISGTGSATKDFNIFPRSTDITLNGFSDGSTFRFFVDGQPLCAKVVTVNIPPNLCRDLFIDSKKEENGVVTIKFSTDPENIDLSNMTFSSTPAGAVVQRTGRTITVTNYTPQTVLTINLGTGCEEKIDFSEIVNGKCEKLDLSPDKYDHRSNPRPEFNFSTSPNNFAGPFTYSIVERNGNVIESGNISGKSFTPNTLLNGTQTVKVFANNFPTQCSDQAPGKYPPDICENIGVIRSIPGKKGVYIPSNGEAIKLQLADIQSYTGNVIWSANTESVIFSDGAISKRGTLTTNALNPVVIRGGTPNTVVTVRAVETDNNPNCTKRILALDEPGDRPGRIIKTVNKSVVGSSEIVTYNVEYIIDIPEFFEGLFKNATIWDDVLSVKGTNQELNSRGRVEVIPGSVKAKTLNGLKITGDLLSQNGLSINNIQSDERNQRVNITYQAKIVSGLTPDACKNLTRDCGERFTNTASDSFGSNSKATVLAVCPFIVSRGFGDVFLEKEFQGGVDIAACSNKKSSEGPVFTPKADTGPSVVSTGAGEQLVGASNRICKNSSKSSANNISGYNNEIKGFSSSVCEVAIQNNEKWQKDNIVKNLNANITKVARNNTNLNGASNLNSLTTEALSTYDQLNPNPKNKVYRKTNGNLTIGSSEDVIVSGGVKTIIIENGNLIINSNIKYAEKDKDTVIAYLVINGNIQIGPDVTEVVGIFAAINTDTKSNKGKIERTEQSNNEITIRGSVYGDIEPLFLGTTATGSISRDRGAVSVIYDGRIVDKTPPGLTDIVKFNQYQSTNQNTTYSN